MSEPKDPAIKLFGKTIPVPDVSPGGPDQSSGASFVLSVDHNTVMDQDRPSTSSNSSPESNTHGDGEEKESNEDIAGENPTGSKPKDGGLPTHSEELANPDTSTEISENPKSVSAEKKESNPLVASKSEEQSETSSSQEKTLKKPDKILPCPRCNSMDTKFCYYNNYNVNQPRHFCRNCQRYWTAGGTMRNVPVGAGRRKNKNSSSHHRSITIPESLHNVRSDLPNGLHHPSLKPNGTVLTFGSDTPLCDSINSVLNLADKTMMNGSRNGFRKPEENNDHPNGSSATASKLKDETGKPGSQDPVIQNCPGLVPPQIPCFPGVPWPYAWNSGQWIAPVLPPTFYPPGFPMPIYPPGPYWGCTVPGNWNIPWLPQPSSSKYTAQSADPTSPTLGKHSRDDENLNKPSNSGEKEEQKENNSERCLWFPKTLRIDDPGEAAKSSIWATLGIRNDNADSVSGGAIFKAFRSKGEEKNHVAEPSPVLQVNPAALSRSINFHESS